MSDKELTIKIYQAINSKIKAPRDSYWHASSISKCPRAQFLARLGTEPTSLPSGAKQLRWDVGFAVEDTIRPYLKELYPDLISNVRILDETNQITGELDNYSEQAHRIIEIKSVHPQAIRYKRVDEDRHHLREDKPYLHHEYQNHVYAMLLGEVKEITYLYISLSGLLCSYTEPIKPEIMEDIKYRLAILNSAWLTKIPPDCICDESQPFWKEQNQYCDYQTEDGCCGVPKELIIKEVKDESAVVN